MLNQLKSSHPHKHEITDHQTPLLVIKMEMYKSAFDKSKRGANRKRVCLTGENFNTSFGWGRPFSASKRASLY